MKVSLTWLKQLVNYNLSAQQLADLLSLKSIGVKQVTDNYIELDLTYNRGDLLSLRGVAKEIAALTNSKVQFEEEMLSANNLPRVSVQVEDSKLCPVYCVAKIENLKVEQSGNTWVKKLSDSDIRTINNVADVTNLVMLEYGQPMHAFDADKVAQETLIVRTAKKEETLITLDGKLRKLDQAELLITDPEKPLGLAGVMGGKDSEISDSTTTILLEAAIFDPVSIRKTSKRLGLYSEAGKRFQHGLTKTNLLQALSTAIKMYQDLGGKLTAITLIGDLEEKPKIIKLTREKINSLIGTEISETVVETSLKSLGFKLDNWQVTVPYWRLDINIEEDLVEEVARMYGYEKIPPRELRGELPAKLDQTLADFIYNLKVTLKDAGLTEVETYSFYSSQTINNLRFTVNNLVKIANPISSETEYLRDYLWPNLIEAAARNFKNGFKDIAIFEIGQVYSANNGGLPNENYHLAVALMNDNENPLTELSGLANSLKISRTSGPLGDKQLFHPIRIAGNMAEVHPRILNKFGLEKRVAIMEINLTELL